MYSVENFRNYQKSWPRTRMDRLVAVHRKFFEESLYRDLTWSGRRAEESLLAMLSDSDFEILVALHGDDIVGFFCFAFERPWMDEEVALCINFYVNREHSKCSQMMMDKAAELCKNRGAKKLWASSTAGLPDNGCNERAFGMFLKRNQFRPIGAFYVREF